MKTLQTIAYSIILLCFAQNVKASLQCPNDVTVTCDADLDDPKTTGTPILSGNHTHYTPSYQDTEFLNLCRSGYVNRKWYIDENYNGQIDTYEHFCVQVIALTDIDVPITFDPPNDLTLDCNEDIPASKVNWLAGPCDFIGVQSKDYLFDVDADACYKILRKHTVIDWCAYDPNDPNWNGEGLYEFKQYIEIIDNRAPKISNCETQYFSLDANCEAEVILTTSAADQGECPSASLAWEAEVDLWADGTVDEVYSYLKSGDLNIKNTGNDELVQVKLKEKLGPGKHKVKWKVKDGCGNWKSCLAHFETIDSKPPTPYCLNGLTIGLDGWHDGEVKVEADIFDRGSFDNCSPKEKIHFAFSNNLIDTAQTFDCTSTGFHTLNVHAFDKEENDDFCMVSLLILDNGSCGFRFNPTGNMVDLNDMPLGQVQLTASKAQEMITQSTTHSDGTVSLQDVPHYDNVVFIPSKKGLSRSAIDIEDFVLLSDQLLYINDLTEYEKLAGDIDGNGRLTPNDLKMLRSFLLHHSNTFKESDWAFIAKQDVEDFTFRKHENAFPITKFDGSLDFVGVMKGDINNSQLDSLDGRSQLSLALDIVENANGYFEIYTQEDYDIDAIQLGFDLSSFTNIESSQIDISANDYNLVEDKLVMIINQAISIDNQQPLLIVKAGNIDGISGKAITRDRESILIHKADRHIEALHITPNPSSNVIRFDRPLSTNVEVVDIMGRIAATSMINPYMMDISNLENGRFFIREKGDITTITSFIKID